MNIMRQKLKILFLCTGNSCRSQMAEGWARHLLGEKIDPYSAGLIAHGLNPRAVQVMKETGVDISHQRSERVEDVADISFDFVVTVCGHADEHCPVFPGKTKIIHKPFDDPPFLSQGAKTEEEALGHFRRLRDEIRAYINSLPQTLTR